MHVRRATQQIGDLLSGAISWDEYFIELIKLTSKRSKDPKRKVGACIVDSKKRIIGIGYNGFPRGCNDSDFSWASRTDAKSFSDSKHAYVVHAEVNAIINCGTTRLDGHKLYTTFFPCNECTKIIIQSGIKEIVYIEAKEFGEEANASLKMLKASGVTIKEYDLVFA